MRQTLRSILFSGIFNVARNPVTNRHKSWNRPGALPGQDGVNTALC